MPAGAASDADGGLTATGLTQTASSEASLVPALNDAVLEADALAPELGPSTEDLDFLAAASLEDFRWTWSSAETSTSSSRSAKAADEALRLYDES